MTKEQYLIIRTMPEIPMDIWFEFYKERGGILQRVDFDNIFSTIIWNNSITINMKQVTLSSAINNFYSYYNEKFGV